MTSKEALKYLLVNSEELYSQYEEDEKFYLDAFELYNIVLKDLEVLEIIKTKSVDINLVKNCYGPLAYAVYNSYIDEEKNDKLTKEEFDLLKEWLENDSNKRIH